MKRSRGADEAIKRAGERWGTTGEQAIVDAIEAERCAIVAAALAEKRRG